MIEALLQAERLLIHGLVDQAERIYTGALAQDPHNAIAVVGLARVALERGDDQLAYTHAQKALTMDPENPAALRLEARLAEVFAARAEPEEDARANESPEEPPETRADARPSERFVFDRNPSMADHRLAEERRSNEDRQE